MRELFLFSTNDNVDITSITYEGCKVFSGKRESATSQVLAIPGVYILMSKNMMYIGQSATNVLTRLKTHESKRPWWTEFIVITSEHGDMEHTVTEYIESHLITHLKHSGFTLDNDTIGNSGSISRFTELNAINYIEKSLYVIDEILKVNLYENQKKSNIDETFTNKNFELIFSTGEIFSGSSPIKVLSSFLSHFAENDVQKFMFLSHEITEVPSSKSIIGDSSSFMNEEKKNYIHIKDDIYMYSKLTSEQVSNQIEYFSEIFGLNIIKNLI